MKLLLLSDHLSVHTIKWATSLALRDVKILIYSLSKGKVSSYDDHPNIRVVQYEIDEETIRSSNFLKKGRYLFSIRHLKRCIKDFGPDVVHAHYASSYGLLGALSGFHPFIISVWGSDVYTFPSNVFKRVILKYSLVKADKVLSTSRAMVKETNKYLSGNIEVIPFGIDTDKFRPMEVDSVFPDTSIVVGTIKSLEDIYGVDYLLRAFKLLKDEFKGMPLKLLIVGRGSKEQSLKQLSISLGIDQDTIFTGQISHDRVPEYLNMLDIYVALSLYESFGVAVLEASACQIPVIVSRTGGLPEVVDDGSSGFIVKSEDEFEAYEALKKLVNDAKRREEMGKKGRSIVLENYNWEESVNKMLLVYKSILPNE